ncbi:hypothetical protein M406DRAFT_265643 [Cryphonectria parasitica EP155]|uniref:CENP-V/GFA domain-containing protein n=1 Tax=Cryphonectria parasitica (strain ATCC 38755 / EP155) TaxID=660469 RepID=A0A9P4XV55_CRYP1|nr:uncharacterized protein M406DRAFT_265643 [Cryphonectria parasitica EP155]KAF3761872.1 hypothetical protein M406DRAFT_265643 [Cryphonectria parasitica EP155]
MEKKGEGNSNSKNSKSRSPSHEPHQHQANATTHRQEDEWKHRAPYRVLDDDDDDKDVSPARWHGACHCGRVKYQLHRDRPLSSKYCHCTTCQRLHGAPFQWAAIFHKEDIRFTQGHHDLGWYDPSSQSQAHHLPCKVQCAFCRTPIMDEGRNMILLFPTLIEGINTPEGRKAFEAKCHMFYPQRVVDFKGDGVAKWDGLEDKSDLLDDDGNVVKKRRKEEKKKEEKKQNGDDEEEEEEGER